MKFIDYILKRKLSACATLIVLVLALAACSTSKGSDAKPAAAPSSQTAAPQGTNGSAVAEDKVQVEAANWEWKVSKTEFKAGQTIHFQVMDKQGGHGFSIVGTDINVSMNEGDTKDVTWVPDKAGEYIIKCSHFCGTGHGTMSTKITVK